VAIQYYDSPFHVTHDEEKANKMTAKMDLSILITQIIRSKGWTQVEAAEKLKTQQSRISAIYNGKIESFTIDAMLDMLEILGFKLHMSIPSKDEAHIALIKDDAA